MRILVMIPAYNEQDNILKTLEDLKTHFPEGDVVVINDCSRDETRKILENNQINYLDLSSNLGIGGAVQAGYLYARKHGYDIAIQFDGDGQHDARFLRDLAAPLADGSADIAIGSRFIRREGFQSSGARRAGISILSGLIRLLCGQRVLDVTSGMRAANRKYILIYADRYTQDYPEPEAILLAGLTGAVIREVPVQMRERENGSSSISALKSAYYMIKVSIGLLVDRMILPKQKKEVRAE